MWENNENSSFKGWTSGFRECLVSSWPMKRAMCKVHDWKMKSCARLDISRVSCGQGQPMKDSRDSLFGKKLCFALPCIYTHYIYHHYPQIVRSAFQRENPRKYTWELEIFIPTIIYTFPCSFLQLLPLHLYILERLLVQTLTTLILSVKWDFGATGRGGLMHMGA